MINDNITKSKYSILSFLYYTSIYLVSFENVGFGSIGGSIGSLTLLKVFCLISYSCFVSYYIIKRQMCDYDFQNSILKRRIVFIYCLVIVYGIFECFSAFYNQQSYIILSTCRSKILIIVYSTLPLWYALTKKYNFYRNYNVYLVTAITVAVSIILVGNRIIDISWIRIDYYSKKYLDVNRTAGLFNNYGDVAILFSFVVHYLLFLVVNKRYFVKVIAFVSIIILAYAMVIAQSRNVLLSVIVSCFMYMTIPLFVKSKSISNVVLKFCTVSVLVVIVSLLISYVVDAVSFLADIRMESIEIRLDMLSGGWQAYKEHFVIGVGPEGYDYAGIAVHNIFLNVLLRAGIGGVLIIYFYMWLLWSSYKKIDTESGKIAFCSLCGILTSISFYPAIENASAILWISVGLIVASLSTPDQPSYA